MKQTLHGKHSMPLGNRKGGGGAHAPPVFAAGAGGIAGAAPPNGTKRVGLSAGITEL
ncbi:hypothetical protein ACFFNY_27925 [Paenibacillus hodogayensis]|uniref:Uncharacterized protein n=1 Tax=Paenibacillus hodogayensis TaxID=279208 RepID=A0ABV5W545_9BACL